VSRGLSAIAELLVNLRGPIYISGIAEAIELSNVVHREIISSLAKWMTNHPENGRGWAHVTHFCMSNCGIIKISPRHAVKT